MKSDDECWEWMASRNIAGYGVFHIKGKTIGAHRLSYMLVKGDIPKGYDLDHLCRNRCCVNPSHLEVVTRRENILRGDTLPAKNAKKTHCSKGHLLPELKLVGGHWIRPCSICNREYIRLFIQKSHQK